jgi:hypothetical protein
MRKIAGLRGPAAEVLNLFELGHLDDVGPVIIPVSFRPAAGIPPKLRADAILRGLNRGASVAV